MIKHIQKNQFWFVCFIIMWFCIGLLYINYPLTGRILTLGDGTSSILIPEYFSRQYASGHLPLWSHENALGVPIAEHMVGAFFVFPLIFAAFPLHWFVWGNYTFFVSFGACFFGRFLEEKGVKRWLSFMMGIVLLLSTYYGGARKYHVAIIECISIIPFVFYEMQVYINTNKKSAIILAGIGSGTMLLAATPSIQYVMYMMIVLFVYVLVEAIWNKIHFKNLLIDAMIYIFVSMGIGAAQIIPGYSLMKRYIELSNSTDIPFNTFVSYSIHPAKLVMMFFPNLFSNIYQAFGIMHSSEMDIEIFLGTLMIAVAVFGVLRYWKDNHIRLLVCLAIGVFIYAANGNISFLARIMYKIPMLNNVRCPSRSLFLFVFILLTISACSLSKVTSDESELKAFKGFLIIYNIIIIISLGIFRITPFFRRIMDSGELNSNYASIVIRATLPLVILNILLYVFGFIETHINHNFKVKAMKAMMPVLCAVVVLISIIEVSPYSMVNVGARGESDLLSSNIKYIKEIDGLSSIITTHDTYNGANASESASSNLQFMSGVPSLNTYLTYNNPNLYFISGQNRFADFAYYNFSGLFTGYTTIESLLRRNDVLSMMGVRYIEDTNRYLDSDYLCIDGSSTIDNIVSIESIVLPSCDQDYESVEIPIKLETSSYYKVSFEVNSEIVPEFFYLDFYGYDEAHVYDDAQQQINFFLEPGMHRYAGYIYSGDTVIPTNTVLRLVSKCGEPILFKNLHVEKVGTNKNVYVRLSEINGSEDVSSNEFWVNSQAKDLFSSVKNLEALEDINEIGICPDAYDFTNKSYFEGNENHIFSDVKMNVSNVSWKSNYEVVANIETDGDTFVNFAQCYDPDWHVYIDGNEAKNYQVNLLIQGFFLDKGRHEIKYTYIPRIVYFGLAVSVSTLLICILCLVYKNIQHSGKCD